jgi:hypothetical protein
MPTLASMRHWTQSSVHSLPNLDLSSPKFNFGSEQWLYFPKRTDFRQVSPEEVNEVVERLNITPRKVLNYQTPLEVFTAHITASVRIDS